MAAAESEEKREIERKRYVHPDLIREILLRLPCKSLLRFKSVCKLFRSFTRDPQFIKEHRERNMKPSHYLIWDPIDQTKLHVYSLSNDGYSHVRRIETHRYRLSQPSSYGLVCLHGWNSKSVALFNPSSVNIMALPDLPSLYALETENNQGAPAGYNYLGFGFDLKSQKYKVVQFIIDPYIQAISECFVLTVNVDSSWRRIEVSNKSNVQFWWQPIYADGVLYCEMDTPIEDEILQIFVFDLSTEKMDVIDSPAKFTSDIYTEKTGKHLTSLQGKLCFVQTTPPTFDVPSTMNIWKLLNVGDVDWIHWYKLEIHNSALSPLCYWSLYPLYIDGNGRIICEGLADLYCYNIHNKSLEIFPVSQNVEGVAHYPYNNTTVIHSETLLTSVNL